MSRKLTAAQRRVLAMCTDGPNLRNGDECTPQWWIEGYGAVHKRTAEFLARNKLVEYCARWGGHPGILGFRITPAGRAILEAGNEA
jgi:hypothetical protein